MERTKGSGRLSEKQLLFLKKTAARGRKHPEKRKFYIFLLVVLLLYFYLAAYLRKHKAAALCGGGLLLSVTLVLILFTGWIKETPSGGRLSSSKQEQESPWEIRDRIMKQDTMPEAEKEHAFMDALLEENADVVGWLTIPGTNIDYPVMQTPTDEDYYLYRDFYGNDDDNGCLLVSTGCDISKDSTNWIIHGHNKKSGAMFGGLSKYRKKKYLREHDRMILETLDGKRTYEIIAVFESEVFHENDRVFKYYQYYDIPDRETFDDFYRNIMDLSLYDTGVTAEYGNRFLTLSTCSYHTENGRLVIVGKEVPE